VTIYGPTPEQRDQQRLHSWPEWDASIGAARLRLGFDPAWAPHPGARQSDDYLSWRRRVELRRLIGEANRALITLSLPEVFREYWIACFLANYERDGLEVICDPQPTGDITPVRVYPPRPDLWFEAGIDYSQAPAMLVIEGPAALASSTVLRAAERRALEAKRRAGFGQQHALVRSRQVTPGLDPDAGTRAHRDERRAKAMHLALAWHANEDRDAAYIALRLGQRGYRYSLRTVQRWLSAGKLPGSDDKPF
jgi:hypothetical protein